MSTTGKQAGRQRLPYMVSHCPRGWLVFRKRWGRGRAGQGPPGCLRGMSRLALLSPEAFLSSERDASTPSLSSVSSVLALCGQHDVSSP